MRRRPRGLVIASILPVAIAAAAGCSGRVPIRQLVEVEPRNPYGQFLAAVGEPDLGDLRDGRTMFRAVWLRSFHEPVVVRLVADGDRLSVITVQGGQGSDPAVAARRDSAALSAERWESLQLRQALRDFWTTRGREDPWMRDGAEWILEGRRDGRYHVVNWRSPRHGANYQEALYRGLFLEILSLGTVCVKPDAVY